MRAHRSKTNVAFGLTFMLAIASFNFGLVPHVFAATVPDSCFVFDSGTGTITNYDPSSDPACLKDVTIPSTIGGVEVTVLGNSAMSNKSIQSIELPDTLTTLGVYALGGNQLTSVIIPNSVTAIQAAAFYSNSQLSHVDFGNSVQTIDGSAFSGDPLSTVILPDSITNLSSGAFGGSGPITTVQVGTLDYTGAPHIVLSNGVFGFSTIKAVTLGNSVLEVSAGAFCGAPIETLDLGESVQIVDSGAFCNSNVKLVHLPASLQKLGTAFWDSSVREVIVDGNTEIGRAHV